MESIKHGSPAASLSVCPSCVRFQLTVTLTLTFQSQHYTRITQNISAKFDFLSKCLTSEVMPRIRRRTDRQIEGRTDGLLTSCNWYSW